MRRCTKNRFVMRFATAMMVCMADAGNGKNQIQNIF